MTTDAPVDPTPKQRWQKREDRLLERIRASNDYYVRHCRTNRRWHHAMSAVVLVSSLLAPIFVMASRGEGSLPWLGRDAAANLALLATLLVGFVEGFRRYFKFEVKWHGYYMAAERLRRAREDYRDARVPLEVGSPEWIAAYGRLRAEVDGIIDGETKEFFERLLSTDPKVVAAPAGAP